MATIQRIPVREPLVDPAGQLDRRWIKWFGLYTDRINAAADRLAFVQKTEQSTAISTTSFPTPALSPGFYRVAYYARITTAATTSSSLTVTLGHTDGSVACFQSGSAITGNTTAAVQSNEALMRIDQATPLTYATAYSSTGATAMQYRLDITVEMVAVEST
jgi:hypothetical protein